MEQAHRARGGAVIAALLLAPLLCALPTEAKRSPRQERLRIGKQQLERADRMRSALEGTPTAKRKKNSYLKAIRTYRRVYDLAPFSGIAARALNAQAELYHDMGDRFGRAYWLKSIETYKFLRREYPKSRYRAGALFNIAQIQHQHLKRLQSAQKSYQELLKRYPQSQYAGKARKALRGVVAKLEAARLAKAQKKSARKAQAKKAVEAAEASKPVKRSSSGKRVVVQNIRYWSNKEYTRVVIDLDGKVNYQEARLKNPDRIFFDLFDTELSTLLSGKDFHPEEGLLSRLRIAEYRSGVTRVVLEVNGAEDYSVFTLPSPYRLVVDIRAPRPGANRSLVASKKASRAKKQPNSESNSLGQQTAAAGCAVVLQTASEAARPTRNGNRTLSRALGLKVNRIVLDPGHGGHDTGTVGRNGLMEKDLVLDVARRLAKRLEKDLCAEVIFTREDDSFIPLENRTALANEKRADLFISIHANSSRNRRVRGVETYYLNFTNDPQALAVAARENALTQKSQRDLQDLVRKITRNDKIDESRELASDIQRTLYRTLRKSSKSVRNRGVKKAPFVVLIGANMPSILAEVAFISNPSDEKSLKSPKGRQRIADGLFTGISRYLKNMNGLAVASVGQ